MFELLLLLTAVVLAITWLGSYLRTRDALHPAIYILPMMGVQYVMRPWFLYQNNAIQPFFPRDSYLETAAFVHLLGVVAFSLGCFPRRRDLVSRPLWQTVLTLQARQNLVRLAVIFGLISTLVYYYSVFAVGGISVAYGRPKGGGLPLPSGYLGEAIGLCVPAVILLLFAWRGSALRFTHWLLIFFFASPYLLTGFLGTRRGPTFLILAAMAFTWFLVYRQRVRLIRVLATVGFIGLLVLILFTNRPRVYLGSQEKIETDLVLDFLMPQQASPGDDYVCACGAITMAQQTGKYGWGRNMIITFLIRPIPKQLWPTKYQDAQRMLFGSHGGGASLTYREVLGWEPHAGSAIGGVADLFREFSWFVIVAMYLYGAFYRALWTRARASGGIWIVLYIYAAGLSIYIPTQSMSAVFHRFLFMSVPTVLLWHWLIMPWILRRKQQAKRAVPWIFSSQIAPAARAYWP